MSHSVVDNMDDVSFFEDVSNEVIRDMLEELLRRKVSYVYYLEKEVNGYSATFLHHRGRNPYHYEYWIHSLDEGGIAAEMPRKYVLELICDYLAACKTYGGNPRNEIDWWLKVSPSIKMHEKTKFYIYRVFDYFHTKLKSSLYEAVTYADVADGLSLGDSIYSEFIEFIQYYNERNSSSYKRL